MREIHIDLFVNVRAVTLLIQKVIPSKKNCWQMVSNIRIRACKRQLELDNVNIDLVSKHVHTFFITEYNETTDNYSGGKSFAFIFCYYNFYFL